MRPLDLDGLKATLWPLGSSGSEFGHISGSGVHFDLCQKYDIKTASYDNIDNLINIFKWAIYGLFLFIFGFSRGNSKHMFS